MPRPDDRAPSSFPLPSDQEVRGTRRRTLATLSLGQVLGNLGAGAAPSIGVLLASAVVESEAWAGVARSATTIGAAIAAVPLGTLALRWGRRGALASAYAAAAVGAGLLVLAAVVSSTALLVVGMMLVGCGAAANFQMRFAAADLAESDRRGRSIALVVWVGTIGSVLGPNLGLPGEALEARWGLPEYTGAFVIGGALMAVAALALLVLLRPDPLLLSIRLRDARTASTRSSAGAPSTDPRQIDSRPVDEHDDDTRHVTAPAELPADEPAPAPPADPARRTTVRAALRLVRDVPRARFALTAQVLAHLVMVSIMTMTPIHLDHHGADIGVVGLVISVHVLGMFGLAPLVGRASDRLGPVPVILGGLAVLGVGAVVGAVAGPSREVVGVALFLVGLGWSVVTVPAAAMLTGAVSAAQRPVVQGAGDMAMNAVAAAGAILSGPVVAIWGFGALCLVTLPALVVVVVAAARLRRAGG
ncbi:MFS transporter [Georgenia sp. Z1344]|uniref:MFS transporter n=1 Tax=Georgenia sp. Z1344 TaxID=3416706 RepID=UPI003CF57A3F